MGQIRVENLRKRFADFIAVRESNLTVENGEFFVMLGPSGCGKTTTLRIIAGLEYPDAGAILLDGADVTARSAAERDIAFVFQLFALYPHMNVRQNIGFPLRCQGVGWGEIRRQVAEVARMLRIEHLLDRPVGQLSSGDRQRTALGRAIVRRPRAFLMDEPLGALDAEFRDVMREELRLLHQDIGATTVYVTHDQIEAMSMADKIAVMNDGDVLQVGTPDEVYARPVNLFVAGFVGSPTMNFLPVVGGVAAGASEVRVNGSTVAVPTLREGAGGPSAVLGARPEHIEIDDGATLRGRVFGVEYLGSRQIVVVDTSVGRLKVRAPATTRANPGETIGIGFKTEALIVFDQASGRALAAAPMRAHG